MIDHAEVWEALESTTANRKEWKANAIAVDILNHRDHLLRFLVEVDGNMSVAELREALEEYKP